MPNGTGVARERGVGGRMPPSSLQGGIHGGPWNELPRPVAPTSGWAAETLPSGPSARTQPGGIEKR
jgi:hypothetical protein